MVRFWIVRKDTRLTFRVPSELKARLEAIAAHEGRSAAQICEAFLNVGSEMYKKEGTKFLQRILSRTSKKPPEQS
jgi:hypothetical protein